MCSVLLFIGSHVVPEEKEIEIKESAGEKFLMNNNELINQLIIIN